MIEIRPVTEKDISLLEEDRPWDSSKHRKRLGRQQKDEVIYLIAFLNDLPVGYLLIKWKGSTEEPMASQLVDCSEIEDLKVRPDYYRQGIGTKLMDEAEKLVRQKKFSRLGLGVGTDNDPAATMYEKRGYKDAGFGTYIDRGFYTDKNGKVNSWEEECVYLIKEL